MRRGVHGCRHGNAFAHSHRVCRRKDRSLHLTLSCRPAADLKSLPCTLPHEQLFNTPAASTNCQTHWNSPGGAAWHHRRAQAPVLLPHQSLAQAIQSFFSAGDYRLRGQDHIFGGLRFQEHGRLRHTCHAAWRGTATAEVKEVKVDLCFCMRLVWPSELPVLQAYKGAARQPHSSPCHHCGTGPAISAFRGRTVRGA